MSNSKILKRTFVDISLSVEDLLLLEAFQIKYIEDRVPPKKFSVLLRTNPIIKSFLVNKYPPIEPFIRTILKNNTPEKNIAIIEEYCQESLWEIADLIVYNKFPELYDKYVDLAWDLKEISSINSLDNKIIIDAGAGSGKLSLMLTRFAKIVYAVEPLSSFRAIIREKAKKEKVKNIYVIDGFLDSIPLPNNSADILVTSNAIGWNIEGELKEIERVIKSGGTAIHLLLSQEPNYINPLHEIMISSQWDYSFIHKNNQNGSRLKYYKIIEK